MTRRKEKVSELLKTEISRLIKEEIPEELGMVTVMDVRPTDDLKDAKVYISCFDKEKETKVLRALKEKTKQFQRFLGQNLKMRYTPKLTFLIDSHGQDIDRIDFLINKINIEKGKK